MKIQLKHTSIDFSNYDAVILHETFSVISLRVRSEIDERCLQLPLIFRDGQDTREAYKRILQARNNGSNGVSLSDIECSYPVETARKIEQYAQYMYDFDKPMKI